MMRVLSVTSEWAPLVKTGGLADVTGALPRALQPHGVEMLTLLPGYPPVLSACPETTERAKLMDCFGGVARILSAPDGLLIVDAPHLYDRGAGIYLSASGKDWPDNAQRFAALSWVAAQIANGLLPDWQPDILHCHDWQAGLAPYYLARSEARHTVRSVMTIHNIAFQGLADRSLAAVLKIKPEDDTPAGLEYFGHLSALKAGLIFANRITTVSPTYAEQLLTAEYGRGMEGILNQRRADFLGILNGIDETVWSPQHDALIQPYATPRGKAANKALLQAELGLPKADGPLCVVVSRMTEQKGLDLLLAALPELLLCGGQLAVLGSGDAALESAYQQVADHPHVAVRIGYDEALSHRMIAGGDAIIVPSRFEPCGLTQLYGLQYGTLPVVALTGGLADTVIPATPATLMTRPVATGVQFYPMTAQALSHALQKLCGLYAQPKLWRQLQANAMKHPVSWQNSAAAYAALYQELLGSAL